MPKRAKTQVTYQVQVEQALEVQVEQDLAGRLSIWGLKEWLEYISLHQATLPVDLVRNAALRWNACFGHRDDSHNPIAAYLTEDAARLIIEHSYLFEHGIDLQHLPQGFTRVAHPTTGICNVIHYNPHLIPYQKHLTPLHLCVEQTREEALPDLVLPEPNQTWFNLLKRMNERADRKRYCSDAALRAAFVYFSNFLKAQGLAFYELSESQVNFLQTHPCHPIVLLGRWQTMLSHAHLKPRDKKEQWDTLPTIHVSTGSTAIRLLTDRLWSSRPCGFVISEMLLPSENVEKQYANLEESLRLHDTQAKGLKRLSELASSRFTDREAVFWQFIATEPKRCSIAFYKDILKRINKLGLEDNISQYLINLLAASTTGENFNPKDPTEEKETQYWLNFIELLTNYERNLPLIMKVALEEGEALRELITHCYRFFPAINAFMLFSISQFIQKFIQNIPILDIDPLRPLEDLSDLQRDIVKHYGAAFYQGARAFYPQDQWKEGLDPKAYLLLIQHLFNKRSKLSKQFIAHFSLFNVTKIEEIDGLYTALLQYDNPRYKPQLALVFAIFDTCKAPERLPQGAFLSAIQHFCDHPTEALDSVAQYLLTTFPDQFDTTLQETLQTLYTNGLTEEERSYILGLEFPSSLKAKLQAMLSSCFRNTPGLSPEERLSLFQTCLTKLQQIQTQLEPQEFAKLIPIFLALPDSALTIHRVLDVLETVSAAKNLEGLHQVHQVYLNLPEPQRPVDVLKFYHLYIAKMKPLLQEAFRAQRHLHQHRFAETLCALLLTNPWIETNTEILIHFLSNFAKTYPQAQEYLLSVVEKLSKDDLPQLINKYTWLFTLPQHTIFTLFSFYKGKQQHLMTILEQVDRFSEEDRQAMLHYLCQLMNNRQPVENAASLLQKLHSKTFAGMKSFVVTLKTPPLPDVNLLMEKLSDSKEQLDEWYNNHFSKQPFGARTASHQFNVNHFEKQKSLFKYHAVGHHQSDIFTDTVKTKFDQLLRANRNESIQALKLKVNTGDPQEKLCALIELLARTTPQVDASGKLTSQELNTTQVMALWAMISHQQFSPKLLNKIDTGEGKSRIMIILAAYQACLGKTVDLITSELSLSERDFLQYQAFFMALEIPTSFLTLDTPAEFYREKCVHFTTNDTLSLLRHKSEVAGCPFDYLHQDPKMRCLLVDEVDKLIDLDTSSKNYATENSALSAFTWVYLRLMTYIQGLDPAIVPTPEAFFTYLDSNHPFGEEIAQLKVLHQKQPAQLKLWLQSARIATDMKKEVHYTVATEKVAVFDKLGRTHYVTPILVVENGCVLKGSTYRDGVHQCLVAREILAAEQEKRAHALLIQTETSLRRSSFAVNTIDRYQAGDVFGMSGTPSFLGKHDKDTNPLHFFGIAVPREKPTQREDLPPILAKDFKQQMHYVKKALVSQAEHGYPLMLVTRDDQQSHAVHAALKRDPFFAAYGWNLLNAKTTDEAEHAAIKKAGLPYTVTIGTAGKLGRGVDIKVKDDQPLSVLALFDPVTTGEEIQIKGRTGRFGQRGTYRMIVNQQDPLSVIPRTRHVERTIQEKQQKQSKEIEQQRTIIETLARFQETLHELWFEKQTLLPADWSRWELFIDQFQKATVELESTLENKPTQEITEIFKRFTQTWLIRFAELVPDEDKSAQLKQAQQRADATVQQACLFLDNIDKHYPTIAKMPKVRKKYDIADDGQNVIYDTPFAQTRATFFGPRPFFANTRAYREGRGEIFAEWRAMLAGERPVFANTRAFLQRVFQWLRALFQRVFNQSPTPQPVPA